MTEPTVTHGTGGFLWVGESDTRPPNAIPIKEWTMTTKPEYAEDGPEGWARRSRPIADVTGSISGCATWATSARRGPGRRKAWRMRMRGY